MTDEQQRIDQLTVEITRLREQVDALTRDLKVSHYALRKVAQLAVAIYYRGGTSEVESVKRLLDSVLGTGVPND